MWLCLDPDSDSLACLLVHIVGEGTTYEARGRRAAVKLMLTTEQVINIPLEQYLCSCGRDAHSFNKEAIAQAVVARTALLRILVNPMTKSTHCPALC